MRCEQGVRCSEQWIAGCRGFISKDIDGGSGDSAFDEGSSKVLLVDYATASNVDEADSGLHEGDLAGADDALVGSSEGNVDGDEVRFAEDAVELAAFDTEGSRTLFGNEGVVAQDAHLKANGAAGDFATDISKPKDAERLAADFDAEEAGASPLAGMHGSIGGRNVASHRHQQGNGVLGGGDGIALGGVDDDDATFGGSIEVDIVDADTGAADDLEIRCSLDDLAGDAAGTADNDGLVGADRSPQLIR